MKTWKCRNCNSENAMNMNFCPICHQPQLQNTAFAPPPLPSAQEQRGADPDFLFRSAAGEMPPERREPEQRSSDPDFLFQTPSAPPDQITQNTSSENRSAVQSDDAARTPGTEKAEQAAPPAKHKSADIPVHQTAVSKDTPWELNPADFAGAAQTSAPAAQPDYHASAPAQPAAPRTGQKAAPHAESAEQNTASRQAEALDQKQNDKDLKMRKILIAANAALLIANIIGLILWLK